jgi:hypothetical protein
MSRRVTRRKIDGGYRIAADGCDTAYRIIYNEAAERPIRWVLERDDEPVPLAEMATVRACLARYLERWSPR